jgi:hypothetical protein
MNMNITQIGRWSFLAGIILALLSGFITMPFLSIVLFILGLAVGFLNIQEKESHSYLVSVIALLVIGVAGLQLGEVTPRITVILTRFIAFVSAAGLVVAVRQIIALALPIPIKK